MKNEVNLESGYISLVEDSKIERATSSNYKFVNILVNLLENESLQNFIAWNSDGTSFSIFDISEFTSKIMLNYFRHNSFTSFVRLLNMYNFKKIKALSSGTLSTYRNNFFRRDEPHLMKFIKRKVNHPRSDFLSKTCDNSNLAFGSSLKRCIHVLSKKTQRETFKAETLLRKNWELKKYLENDFYYVNSLEGLLTELIPYVLTHGLDLDQSSSRRLPQDVEQQYSDIAYKKLINNFELIESLKSSLDTTDKYCSTDRKAPTHSSVNSDQNKWVSPIPNPQYSFQDSKS